MIREMKDENNLNENLKWMYVYSIRLFIKATQHNATQHLMSTRDANT